MKLNIKLNEKSRQGVVEMLNTLLADEFVLATRTRNCHWNDAGTADFLTSLMEQHEKMAWMLRSILTKES